jgi:hypothetical protein
MPAYCHHAAYDAFALELPRVDSTTGLFRAAFAIARHELPDADVTEGEATINELADTIARGVDEIRTEDTGELVTAGLVDVGKRLRPNFRDGKIVLYATRNDARHWEAVRVQ